jgi:hypothetical protein
MNNPRNRTIKPLLLMKVPILLNVIIINITALPPQTRMVISGKVKFIHSIKKLPFWALFSHPFSTPNFVFDEPEIKIYLEKQS